MKDFRSGIKGIAAVYKPFRWRLAASVLIGLVSVTGSIAFVWVCKCLVDIATGVLDRDMAAYGQLVAASVFLVLMAPGLLALLHPGMVLILDEATSALDSATETAVLERFAAEYRGHRTILMITHRECALTYADEILRLD